MNVGSAFTGIGGLDRGLELAGHRVIFQCEKDPYRRRVLKRHWPDIPCYEDVREVASGNGHRGSGEVDGDGSGPDAQPLRSGGQASNGARGEVVADRLERGERDGGSRPDSGRDEWPAGGFRVGLLCGGFPCQDLSIAGLRAGLSGDRSGLFFEFARVADAVLPDGGWLLLENVPGLLSSNGGRDFAVILATLAELGFHDLAWRVLDSRYFGVPQRRRRIYILARRARGRRASEVLLEPESGGGDSEAGTEAWEGATGGAEDGPREPGGNGHVGTVSAKWRKGSGGPAGDEVQNIIAAPLGAAQARGVRGARGDLDHETYVPTTAAGLTKGSAVGDGVSYPGRRKEDDENLVAGTVRSHARPGSNEVGSVVAHTLRSEGFDASEDGTGRGTPLVAHTLTSPDPNAAPIDGRRQDGSRTDRIPIVVADGEEADPDRVRAASGVPGRMDGDPVTFNVYPESGQGSDLRATETDHSPTLDATAGKEQSDRGLRVIGGAGGETCAVDPKPDGPRYAACGDAVTVNVAEWIGRRLAAAG